MSTILIPGGPDVQINTDNCGGNGVAGPQQFPQIAAGGRPFRRRLPIALLGNAADNDIIADRQSGRQSVVAGLSRCVQRQRSADDAGGRCAAQWRIRHRLHQRTARRRYARSERNQHHLAHGERGGRVGTTSLAIGDFNGGTGQDALQAPAIATLQSGRQLSSSSVPCPARTPTSSSSS